MENELLKKYSGYFKLICINEKLIGNFNRAENELNTLDKNEQRIRNSGASSLTCGLMVTSIFLGLFFIIGGIKFSTTFGEGSGVLVVLGLVLGGFGIFGFDFFEKLTKEPEKRERKGDEYHEKYVVPAIEDLKNAGTELDKFHESDKWKDMVMDVPLDFLTVDALLYFVKMLENKQADTEKELYNLYQQKRQYDKMMNIQAAQIQLAQHQIGLTQEVIGNQQAQLEYSQAVGEALDDISNQQRKLSKQQTYGNIINTLDYMNNRKNNKK